MKKQAEILGELAVFGLRYQVGAEILRSLTHTVHDPLTAGSFSSSLSSHESFWYHCFQVGRHSFFSFFFLFEASSAILLTF